MIEEYQRLQEAARDVEREIADLEQNHRVNSAAELAAIEHQLDILAVKRSSLTKAMILLRSVNNLQFQQKQKELVRHLPHKYHSQGLRRKVVQTPGGVTVTLKITCFHRQKDPAKASQKPERGLYPALILSGLSNGLTPHVRCRMAKASALLGSYEEAAEMLSDDGITVSVNKLREVCGRIGHRLVQMTTSRSMQVEGSVEKRRIVVSMDGGRVCWREPRERRTKKERKKFTAKWREPRLLIIYAVDEHGRMADDFAPIIDGTLGSCDRLFAILQAYLVSIRITEASRLLFVADGASWIWTRIPKLIAALGLKSEQIQELIDFWHAVEYLGKIAESRKLTGAKRKHWLTVQKRRLLNGEIGSVVMELEKLRSGRRTKEQATWLNYFQTHGLNSRRMDYSTLRRNQMLIGSGAIENAVQRIINLRVKSNSTYWLRENAETMIRLRAWLKAGRAEELFRQTTYGIGDIAA
ncbi:MAG: hypothetical protein WCK86_07010 [Planctomycetia bacterium]